LAHDTVGTIEEAKRLWTQVDRPNALIKIPATLAGLDAITEVIAAGISVNVTLIFSIERYEGVMNAYLSGLERARANGIDLSTIRSVASFFVSRVDTELDRRLREIGTIEAETLTGQAGVANARLAYQLFHETFSSPRAVSLLADGAHVQRPLWASTGVKDPDLSDTLYVTQLVAADVVNTMPEKTLLAVADHGVIEGDTITSHYESARVVFSKLDALGIDFAEVTTLLETEGVEKFIVSWGELLETVKKALEASL
jgi:transaldolase